MLGSGAGVWGPPIGNVELDLDLVCVGVLERGWGLVPANLKFGVGFEFGLWSIEE
jgi:hypothetical protein